MRKIYFAFFTLLFAIASLIGCKLDPPIYPTDNVNTGTGTAPVLSNGGTITYTINGIAATLTVTGFQVIAPDAATMPTGNTQILGGTSPAGGFSLSFSNTQPGTYDIDVLYMNGMVGQNGKVTITQLNTTDGFHGTIKGTFTTDLIDASTGDTIPGVTGTFNISK